jgi:hypothetical protein
MIQPIVIAFVFLALVFSLTHWIAVTTSLYWYYWWFDILMHFWGGLLIAFGIVSLTTFRSVRLRPTLRLIFGVSLLFVLAWEFFEWQVGLLDPQLHWLDSLSDISLGLLGGLTGYALFKRYKI